MELNLVPDRLRKFISVEGNCWIWTGALSTKGYGTAWWGGKCREVHAVLYDLLVGPVPDGFELDHKCRTPKCCNPGCLEPVTHQVNVLRGISFAAVNAVKTHCPQGHLLAGDNLYIYRGSRYCRACHKQHSLNWARAHSLKVKQRAHNTQSDSSSLSVPTIYLAPSCCGGVGCNSCEPQGRG